MQAWKSKKKKKKKCTKSLVIYSCSIKLRSKSCFSSWASLSLCVCCLHCALNRKLKSMSKAISVVYTLHFFQTVSKASFVCVLRRKAGKRVWNENKYLLQERQSFTACAYVLSHVNFSFFDFLLHSLSLSCSLFRFLEILIVFVSQENVFSHKGQPEFRLVRA